jgi:hypothetical protein
MSKLAGSVASKIKNAVMGILQTDEVKNSFEHDFKRIFAQNLPEKVSPG